MRIIKYTHACVRIEHDGGVLVIDPGIWSEPRALLGADAVLLTHAHYDHADQLRLAGLQVPVFAPDDAPLPHLEALGAEPHRLRPGQSFEVTGLRIDAVGGEHARVLPDQPNGPNLGYLFEDELYHPGDALAPPPRTPRVLAVPMQGSWLKTVEAIEFARGIAPQRSFGMHEAQLNERGLPTLIARFTQALSPHFAWVEPGNPL